MKKPATYFFIVVVALLVIYGCSKEKPPLQVLVNTEPLTDLPGKYLVSGLYMKDNPGGVWDSVVFSNDTMLITAINDSTLMMDSIYGLGQSWHGDTLMGTVYWQFYGVAQLDYSAYNTSSEHEYSYSAPLLVYDYQSESVLFTENNSDSAFYGYGYNPPGPVGINIRVNGKKVN